MLSEEKIKNISVNVENIGNLSSEWYSISILIVKTKKKID
jgi:hypothetical protein